MVKTSPRRDESEAERLDRNFSELLQELRVAQTGVQILFAFLLTLAFSARFGDIDNFGRIVYLIALLSAAAATALIIGPVAYHRILFRRGQKPTVVWSAHRLAGGGLTFLLIAMVCSVLLVTDFLLDRTLAVVISAVTGVWFVLLWFALPLLQRNGSPDPPRGPDR
jgi:hypothetical protein